MPRIFGLGISMSWFFNLGIPMSWLFALWKNAFGSRWMSWIECLRFSMPWCFSSRIWMSRFFCLRISMSCFFWCLGISMSWYMCLHCFVFAFMVKIEKITENCLIILLKYISIIPTYAFMQQLSAYRTVGTRRWGSGGTGGCLHHFLGHNFFST